MLIHCIFSTGDVNTISIGDNVTVGDRVMIHCSGNSGNHPTSIGNNVVIYSNSTILGTIKVGDNSVIGGNLWVDQDVPEGSKLTQKK